MNTENFAASPTAIKAGIMIERHGEPCFTPAGIFALAGMMAYDPRADKESSLHCAMGIHRVLDVAKLSGLPEQTAPPTVSQCSTAHRFEPAYPRQPVPTTGRIANAWPAKIARLVRSMPESQRRRYQAPTGVSFP